MSKAIKILIPMSAASIIGALYLVWLWVPTEAAMGIVQRIFYFHVPMAWIGFLAFFIVFLSSILYLARKNEKWDTVARSAAEIGIIFTSLVLITGPMWAKAAWGTWWTWDIRLTTTLVLWLIYLAYLIVRPFASEPSRGARYAAVVGIAGFLDVPIVALSIQLWRTQHPGPVIFQGGLAPSMLLTLMVSLLAFTIFFFLLLLMRVSLNDAERQLELIKDVPEDDEG